MNWLAERGSEARACCTVVNFGRIGRERAAFYLGPYGCGAESVVSPSILGAEGAKVQYLFGILWLGSCKCGTVVDF